MGHSKAGGAGARVPEGLSDGLDVTAPDAEEAPLSLTDMKQVRHWHPPSAAKLHSSSSMHAVTCFPALRDDNGHPQVSPNGPT